MKCCRCGKQPHEIDEYRAYAGSDDPAECAKWVREEEGTYNPRTDTFACTDCYIRMGSPSSPRGWKAPGGASASLQEPRNGGRLRPRREA